MNELANLVAQWLTAEDSYAGHALADALEECGVPGEVAGLARRTALLQFGGGNTAEAIVRALGGWRVTVNPGRLCEVAAERASDSAWGCDRHAYMGGTVVAERVPVLVTENPAT
jgi:hypothetical protein